MVAAQEAPGPSTTVGAPPASTPAGGAEAPAGTAAAAAGRTWLVPVPVGCTVPNLPDVVFVGTLLDKGTPAGLPDTTENETARFRLDQARAGSLDRFTFDGIVDVRYGADTKDLETGEQYLVGASVAVATGALTSTVREAEPAFGGDDVIAAAQQDVKCPRSSIRCGRCTPTAPRSTTACSSRCSTPRARLLRSILLPLMVVIGVVFALVLVRWLFTGASARRVGGRAHVEPATRACAARCGLAPERQPRPRGRRPPPLRTAGFPNSLRGGRFLAA